MHLKRQLSLGLLTILSGVVILAQPSKADPRFPRPPLGPPEFRVGGPPVRRVIVIDRDDRDRWHSNRRSDWFERMRDRERNRREWRRDRDRDRREEWRDRERDRRNEWRDRFDR
jgi:hypothetical protein